MRKKVLISFSVFLLLYHINGQEGKPVWAEEFNGLELDESIWNFELGDGCPELCGWGNNERQIYTKTNHRLEEGFLYITADLKEDSIYSSARITTKDKFEFQYGYIEARIALPEGVGLWPAFWLLGSNMEEVGWPQCGEIDVMEYVGREPGMVFSTLHTPESFGNSMNSKKIRLDGIEEDFHTYAANWTKDKIEFFVDNTLIYTYGPENKSAANWPFDQPFYMLLNVAIGGAFGGPEVDDAVFPQDMVVDYIRVYQN